MDIKEEIRKLRDLQDIDSKFLALKNERDLALPGRIAELKESFESKKSILSALEEEVKRSQVKKKERELDLATKEEGVSKCQGQLYQLKTNQEYKAKLKEIESLKADISVIEEDILKIMEEVDQKAKTLNEKKEEFKGQEAELNKAVEKIEQDIKQLDIQVKGLEDKRGILTQGIDSVLLKDYEHLLNNRWGLALVPLKAGSCGGCHMNLPPEVTNKVKQYIEIIYCEFCARMLYLEEDFQL
ncbi:MAG: hypothetical protein JW734_00010 [Candidatus Omnitrophica bacterium]|nr:hypothetical protein [Candidatus Omnitrophota bacterium]